MQNSSPLNLASPAQSAIEPGLQNCQNVSILCPSQHFPEAGMVDLTQSIADETKGTNIVANLVLPSVIDTPTHRAAMDEATVNQAVKPEPETQVICFLAAAAKDIRGAVVPVYGSL